MLVEFLTQLIAVTFVLPIISQYRQYRDMGSEIPAVSSVLFYVLPAPSLYVYRLKHLIP